MEMTGQISFNTGRFYAPEGQIIVAKSFGEYDPMWFFKEEEEISLNWVEFHDTTRNIKGKILNCRLTESDIMSNYDAGNYEPI